jgi:RNA ligase
MDPMTRGVARAVELLRSGELAGRYTRLVNVQTHPGEPLAILNYTQECQYSAAWDEVTMACRGLIVDRRTWQVAAWPFVKFFNVNERPETRAENLPAEPFDAFEKWDGSLGIFVRTGAGPALASRGSFTSEQSRRGTELLLRLGRLGDVPDELTLLFEIIYPENKSVIRYDFSGLVLLAGFNRFTGEELSWEGVEGWAERLGCRTPRRYPFRSLPEVLESRATLPAHREGYVVRFASGLRVKLKGDAYLTLHRLVWGLSEKRVLEALAEGGYAALLGEVPEEFRGEVEGLAAKFHRRAAELEAEARRLFEQAPRDRDRKTFALWVQANAPRHLSGPLFQMWERKATNWYRLIQLRDPAG